MNGQLEAEELDDMHEVDVLPGMMLRPGDVLVVSSDFVLTASEVALIRQTLMRQMPELADVVVLAKPLTVQAVYRPNEGVSHE